MKIERTKNASRNIFFGIIFVDRTCIGIYQTTGTAQDIFKKDVDVLEFLKLILDLCNQPLLDFIIVR